MLEHIKCFVLTVVMFLVVCLVMSVVVRQANGADLLSTQSGTSIAENTWTAITPSGIGGHRLDAAWMKAHYVPSLDMVCLMGAYRQRSTEPNDSWVCYSFKENKLYVLDIGSEWQNEHFAAAGHPVAGSAIDITTGVIFGWGNFSGSQVSERGQGTYAYDFNSQTGRNLQTATRPNINANQPAGAFDPVRNKLVIHGGFDNDIGTHEYSTASNTWAHGVACVTDTTDCPGPGVKHASMAYRTVDAKLYMFGGMISSTLQDELFVYAPATQTWTRLTPTGGPPAARQMHGWVYMQAHDKFLMYGGGDTATTNLRTDTWIYDPVDNTWTQLTPAASPSSTTAAVMERLAYVAGDDVVILFNLGDPEGDVWAYRYKGQGKAGRDSAASYSPTAGFVNRTATSWAKATALAGNSTTVLGGWVETGPSSDTSTAAMMFWPYVSRWTGSTRDNLGSAYNSIAQSDPDLQSDNTSVAYVGSTPWACWSNTDYSTILSRVETAEWNGSSWTSHGAVGQLGDAVYFQGPCQVADVNGTPHFVVKEEGRDTSPVTTKVFVTKWTGAAYSQVGGALNRDGATQKTGSVSIASNGTQPCVAFTEYTLTTSGSNGGSANETAPNAYASCWDGDSWEAQGGVVQPTDANLAFDVAAAWHNGQLYVALTERTAPGPAKVYVRTWNGSAWSTVGGSQRTRDTSNGWAFRPRLVSDGSNLYLAWLEQGNATTWAYSQPSYGYRPRVFVDKWDGSAWTKLGGSLNADSFLGSGQRPDIAIMNGNPVVIWGEVKHGAFRNVYLRQWNGDDWSTIADATESTTLSRQGGTSRIGGVTRR